PERFRMLVLICGCVLSGLIVSAAVTAAMRRLAPRWGLVDQPSARKVHVVPTPLGGGIGILLGVVVPLVAVQVVAWWLGKRPALAAWLPDELTAHLAGIGTRSGELWGIVAAGLIISALGLIDDLRALKWQPKLIVQFLVAAGLVAGGVRATVFVQWP